MLESISIHAFIDKYNIKTDTGIPLDFKDHQFMWDIYSDFSPKQVGMKAAQVTWSTCAVIKSFWVAKYKGFDLIYLLPTENDRNTFVGGKVNRIIYQNPVLEKWTKDKDSIEQKQIDDNFIHFKGSWTQKAAIMVPSDLNVYDEVDSSKQDVIDMYATRLQHSKNRWEWFFSHPSAEGFGVHKKWELSDQKHWFIKCKCGKEQYLNWPESIDEKREIFVCKYCGKEITDDQRRNGRWVKKFKDREFSGYWVPLLIAPWVSAKDIIKYKNEKTEEYFYNKVLGLPYVGGGNKLTWQLFSKNLVNKTMVPSSDDPVVMGIDTGLKLDYVLGGNKGLFYHNEASEYSELDAHMRRWPKMIAVIDAGGDLIGSREFQERWRGRVFLCYLGADRKTSEIFNWKEGDEYGTVIADRNRSIQLTVDDFRTRRIPIQGTEADWHSYWLDWNNLTRVKIFDNVTGEPRGFKWVRNGRDHLALATVFWRMGMDKLGFGEADFVGEGEPLPIEHGVEMDPDGSVPSISKTGHDLVGQTIKVAKISQEDYDWRN